KHGESVGGGGGSFGAPEKGDRPDHGPRESELLAHPAAPIALSLSSTTEFSEIHAGRYGDHAFPVNAGLDHQGANGLATRDHPVGEPSVDGVPAPPYRDRDVAGPDHRPAGAAARPPAPPAARPRRGGGAA